MYLLIIGWLYVALMMTLAEATNPAGTVLGALITFVLYGAVPVSLLFYLLYRPGRNKAVEKQQPQQPPQPQAPGDSGGDADRSGKAPADPVTPVRKEP